MKIGILSPLSGVYSGAHEYAIQLFQSLKNAGHECELLTVSNIGTVPITAYKVNVGKRKNNWQYLQKFDMLHLTSVSENGKSNHSVLEKYSEFLKYVVTFHSCFEDIKRSCGWKEIAKNAKMLIFTSESNRKWFCKNYSELFNTKNTIAIEMPFNPINYKKEHKKENIVCNVSRLITYKRIREFISCAEHIKDFRFIHLSRIFQRKNKYNAFLLGLIGKNYYEPIIKTIEKKGLTNAKMYDYINLEGIDKMAETKLRLLSKSKYLVDLSTLKEDNDRVQYTTLEAMDNHCVPIFSPKFFGKLLKENVNGIPAEETEEAVSAIIKCEKDEQLKKSIIKNNLEFIKEHYTNNVNINKYIELYNKIIKNG